MEKKIYAFLFSTRLMAVLFIGYAIAMIFGTFIESKYNTDTARIWIYNSWWFEAIHVFFLINFFGNIKRYKLYKKEKWATLLLHLSFIFIIVGAAITRYISYEGMMPIREGEISNRMYSDKNFLTVFVDGEYEGSVKRRTIEKSLLLSPVADNSFLINKKFGEIPFEISYKNYVLDAKEVIKEDEKGVLYLKLVESGDGTRHEHWLKEGEVQNIHNLLFALNKPTDGAVNINTIDNTIVTPFDGQFMRMADKFQGKVTKDSVQALMYRSLYNLGGTQFVLPEAAKKGFKTFEASGNYKPKQHDDALTLIIRSGGEEKEITLVGSKGKQGEPVMVKLGKLDFTLMFGSKVYELPFKLKLNDFIADKYPGTEKSYSAFESKVTVIDSANKFDARIYMNHILDYRGFRFFQASFDQDEKGTVLSVNHDFWGTTITYIGYFLLFFCMMAILFVKNTRFADLKKKLETVKKKKAKLLSILLILSTTLSFSQENHSHKQNTFNYKDSILKYKVPEAQADRFGRLVIQDDGGRMKPINTFSSELLRKVSHNDTYEGMNSDQVFISMKQFPFAWMEIPLVYVKKDNDSIRKLIGVEPKQKLIPFAAFFDKDGNYKLAPYLDEAYKTANPNQFEKDFVETDKKINLLNSALFGSILKIYPVPNDKNNKWVSNLELNQPTGTALDTIKAAFPLYLQYLAKGTSTKEYAGANMMLEGMEKFQMKYGREVMPSMEKVNYEILYNKYDVFKKLPYWYISLAILMFVLVISQIFKDRKFLRVSINVLHVLIGLCFALHTVGLIARWYISGHAPWSNAYEAIVYVAWATMFFGLAFDRKSKLTVASSAFVTAMILTAAYANWIDPEIANLQPVLNSYWLMIHVAVIVASYGPFALGFILGFVSLLLMFFTNEKNKVKMDLNIKELTYINEMALTVGLVMLTIGNFLGGQWANESWGRYWGWDPKETWALISIMVYAFVIHARFVPGMKSRWIFNLMAMFAFMSILFTYYGVNFHLVGLHSYASGEAKSLAWIYEMAIGISVVGILTYPKFKKYYKK
ncbi:cytochrome c biogenesis protein CcsA [Flavobacterium capsici]|uniref:Cytochrome c biogenesis protein CcsA n=1 Tax=Flavobacterium capsici TaxID=3075618 RepID=A0AA96J621_9FLAO|nr:MULTISPECIES: cytochrome c biogenesis protein CcsA [unclassified Flavobacterium]WNM18222.1 cytochrome c biogenesis protein CcsA [Flavobacterium sp. PMR2A8]WNM22273.1 cytochrome c biogenesis protein CcsA [Flavobacterium sp. PMTSA4]